MYKLVIIDIDDTLLNDHQTISLETKITIREAIHQGVGVTLATGRMFASAQKIAKEIGVTLPLITYQGALIKGLDERVLCEWQVPSEVVDKVIQYCHLHNYHLHIYSGDQLYVKANNEKVEFYTKMHDVSFHLAPDFNRFVSETVTKMVIFEEAETIQHISNELSLQIGESSSITRSKPYFLEILHKKAKKEEAIQVLCTSLGYDLSEVMAIGDSWNDIGMLETAGFSVAMDNAVEELKKIADVITNSNNEDGVGKAIEKFILD